MSNAAAAAARAEIEARIEAQFAPEIIVKLIRLSDMEGAVAALTCYGDFRATKARSEGFQAGMDAATASLDRAIAEVARKP